ncbi:NAD(P)/FAD-dependent oxidoreductase [Rubrobacter aplysinae]|uniref:NAD(P)/FAD-dependent oxidoreductase n=1 Tax=Rubrobacter aplysinae TaxID=909625 RepID=UPI00064BF4C3|nr:NAD(P)/FAD-dependent oxidoreductase [Rubrobacter aplysinae]
MTPPEPRRSRVVVVGAGFAGASLIRSLPPSLRRPGQTLLVDQETEWDFIPLIHEVAVGRVHPDSVRSSIPALCRGRCDFLRASVEGISPETRTLHTSAGPVEYEYLVLAAGSRPTPPPAEMADSFGLFWSLGDALSLRSALDEAWRDSVRGDEAEGTLTVTLVGGGATGVELAAEIASLFDYLKKRTPRPPAREPRVVLLEATDRLLGWLDPYFHEVALRELRELGVEVRLNTPVTGADGDGVSAGDERIPARARVWTAGVHAAPLNGSLDAETDGSGRAALDGYLTLPDHPEIYVPGDAGVYTDPDHGPLPPTASVAVQQGPWIARDLDRRTRGRERRPFSYFDRGYVVSLGPESAVAEAAGAKFSGPKAQALYRSIFLYYLRGRRARLLTGADWSMERTIGRLGFDTTGRLADRR